FELSVRLRSVAILPFLLFLILLLFFRPLSRLFFSVFVFLFRRPSRSTLFPYTTLFRSCRARCRAWAWRCRRTRVCVSDPGSRSRSEEHTSELQSRFDLVCRLLLEKKKKLKKLGEDLNEVLYVNVESNIAMT